MKQILGVFLILMLTSCSRPSKQQQIDAIVALEQSKHTYEELGEPQAVISFGVITSDRKIFVDGIVPWASVTHAFSKSIISFINCYHD